MDNSKKAERWQQIEQLYHAALERDTSQRAAFLHQACAGDEALRRELESLLASRSRAENVIEAPTVEVAAKALAKNQPSSLVHSLVGRQVGCYQILSLLGTGGMGEVYQARDTKLERVVALKILPVEMATEPKRIRRFVREAKAASALKHPNAAHIYEIGEANGLNFIAMEYVEGQTLAAKIRGQPLDSDDIVEIGLQITDALDEAHGKGITHRDLKPGNIMLTPRGQVKILDFGLAKISQPRGQAIDTETNTLTTTESGAVIGTVSYMSPEQALGREVDQRSDIFSLGVVIYEMATGQQPFSGANVNEVLERIVHAQPEAIARLNYNVPAELERIVRKCLEKDRERRYQTAHELLVDLRNLKRDSHADAAVAGQVSPHARSAFRRWPVIALVVMVLILVAGRLYFTVWREQPIDSLAVLPFVNGSGDPNAEYLSDGITESLINSLSQLPDLKVIARSSVFNYKGLQTDTHTVGEKLAVRALLTGKITPLGEYLVISAELSNVKDRRHIWGGHYRKRLADVFSLQDDLARDITEQLRLKLSVEKNKLLTKRYTENAEAYQLYMQGRLYLNQRSSESISKALELFTQAISKDRNYAYAYSGLSDGYALLAAQAAMSPKEAYPKAVDAAEKAVKLDGELAEGHTSLAHARLHTGDDAGAEQEFKRAIQLKPNYATAYHWYSELLWKVGRETEAIAADKQALELDPLDLATNADFGSHLKWTGHLNESLAQYLKTLEIKPNYFVARYGLGNAYLEMGKYAEAADQFKQVISLTKGNRGYPGLARVYVKLGQRQEAEKILKETLQLAKQRYVDPLGIATIYAALDDKEQAFVWLEKVVEQNPEALRILRRDAGFENLQTDARYVALLRRAGLPP